MTLKNVSQSQQYINDVSQPFSDIYISNYNADNSKDHLIQGVNGLGS